MADDFVLNVRQIAQYPLATVVGALDVGLIQQGGLGGPYMSMRPADWVGSAMELGGFIHLAPGAGLAWNGAVLTWNAGLFSFSEPVWAPAFNAQALFIDGSPVPTTAFIEAQFALVAATTVHSFNGRTGRVLLETDDVLRAGGAPIWDAHFGGDITAPTVWNFAQNNDTVATTAFVQGAICNVLESAHQVGALVFSFDGRGGDVVLNADDVTLALTQPGVYGRANSPPLGDASSRIATTLFVDETNDDLKAAIIHDISDAINLSLYAPLASPNFTGNPTAPTANAGTTTGQLATTAFVMNAVAASTAGVATFNTRTGAVVLNATDLTNAGGALLNSPHFTGVPQTPTAALHNSTLQLASTAFVVNEIASIPALTAVTSFNTRTGAVTLTTSDITAAGGAPAASPVLSGNPTAPTPAPGDNDTSIATTAFVTAAVAAAAGGVMSFNGRTGAVSLLGNDISAVGGAMLTSPAFAGTPTAPTANPGTSNTQLATTAFVAQAISGVIVGVTSFNTRTGAVTLQSSDITGAGGAVLASPNFSGVPTAPTAAQTSNDTTVATTAYVRAALAAAPGGVSSFNSRTGNITLLGSDVSAAGGALTASPSFSGTPLAPTAVAGTSTTQLATTAFVANAIAASGGVSSVNGRAGAVVLGAADIIAATGATYAQADAAPAVGPNQRLWFNSLNGNLYVQYTDPSTTARSWVVANNPPPVAPASGSRVLITAVDITTPVTAVDFFNGFDGTYNELELNFWDVLPATEAQPLLRCSIDGSTFDTTAAAYNYMYQQVNSTGTGSSVGSSAPQILLGGVLGVVAQYNCYGRVRILRTPNVRPTFLFHTTWANSGGIVFAVGGGLYSAGVTTIPQLLKGLRFLISGSANITRGSFRLYGIAK